MSVRYDNAFGEWLKKMMEEHRIKSSRGFAARGIDVAHTTIESLLRGRQPSVETAIKIAAAFHLPIEEALDMAGYPDVAEIWGKDDPQKDLQNTGRDDSQDNNPENDSENDPDDDPDNDAPPLSVARTGANAPRALTYELTDEEKEDLISSVQGVAPAMRPAALAAIKGLLDNLPRFEEGSPAYGRRPQEPGQNQAGQKQAGQKQAGQKQAGQNQAGQKQAGQNEQEEEE